MIRRAFPDESAGARPRSLKPWPADAVMIVAARAGEERAEEMEGPHPANCRDCGAALVADTFTVRHALQLPGRRGRPVMFFCGPCSCNYDPSTITRFIDHRGRRPQ